MYGSEETSRLPRTFLIVNHFLAILLSAWLLFGGGIGFVGGVFGYQWQTGDLVRRVVIFSCSFIYFIRIIGTTFVILKRKMDWSESVTIVIWVYLIHALFAFLGGTESTAIGMIGAAGILLYIFGSYLNTRSEYLRKIWKENPKNNGKLYTEGLFRYSMHINYFGDLMLFTGIAFITRSMYAFIIPLLMFLLFTLVNIPMLDKYLANKYGLEFQEYSGKTKKFIPFVY